MSIARGVLRGFIKEGLEQKNKRDEFYGDMVREVGQEFKKGWCQKSQVSSCMDWSQEVWKEKVSEISC